MSNPFPGMNPFLEDDALWPSFHHQLITALYQMLLPGLVDRYRARLVPRQYTSETPLFTSVVRVEHREETLEIRLRNDGRLITLIDVVSPGNKTTEEGRLAYRHRRCEARAEHANLVEIDLVLEGQPVTEYPKEGLPDLDYAIAVTRAARPDPMEVYPATLQSRLPKFHLPMGSGDRDVIVDLHTTFLRSFDQGSFASQIDYSKDPATTLSAEDRAWLDGLLREHRLRP